MPKRKDENEIAFSTLEELIRRDSERDGIELPPKAKPEKVPSAVRAGRLGGLKGGRARAKALPASKRREIAKKAAGARWKRKSPLQS